MSVVTVQEAKTALVVIHNHDDLRLQQLIDDAEDECLQFIDRPSLPRVGVSCPDECDTSYVDNPVSDGADLPKSIRRGILLIVQAAYEGKDADEMTKLRKAAEVCWFPHRCRLGV
ncbi:MAG: phage gp6-like head-tail connector protein [Pseudomonadota bacterium]|nr:phage gp6-like head-tail connector protein [Pseudomonadota bacterium]